MRLIFKPRGNEEVRSRRMLGWRKERQRESSKPLILRGRELGIEKDNISRGRQEQDKKQKAMELAAQQQGSEL